MPEPTSLPNPMTPQSIDRKTKKDLSFIQEKVDKNNSILTGEME
jgi:hypothetical protein